MIPLPLGVSKEEWDRWVAGEYGEVMKPPSISNEHYARWVADSEPFRHDEGAYDLFMSYLNGECALRLDDTRGYLKVVVAKPH